MDQRAPPQKKKWPVQILTWNKSIVCDYNRVGIILINPTTPWLNQIFQTPIWIDSDYGVELSYKAYMYGATSELAPTSANVDKKNTFSLYSYPMGKP